MGRTRAAVLTGAVRAVEVHGARKATMADIAAAAGIAKGTLYNHFRTKEAVFAATLEASVERLADEATDIAGEHGPAPALAALARRISTSAALHRLREEPAALLPLVAISDAPIWKATREALAGVLAAAGCRTDAAAVEVALRWLVGHVAAERAEEIDGEAAVMAAGLSPSGPPGPSGTEDTSS
jgi:AcrR family transcriptional regulator